MEINDIKIILNKKLKLITVLFLISTILLVTYNFKNIYRGKELEIIYLDIGQGDSILIKSPSGVNSVIDTGSSKIAAQKIQKKLSFLNKSLDMVLLTHPDSDHSGGIFEINKSLIVKNLIISSENDYSNYTKDEKSMVSLVSIKDKIAIDPRLNLKILSPSEGMNGDDNQKSIVNTISYGNFNFIFTGDADSETERKLISLDYFDKKEGQKAINILKVGHHGSDTSSSIIFLKAIKPEYCIISVGKDNKYKHPSKNAMDRLEKYCKNIYRTDLDGNIYFKTDGKSLKIDTEK